MSERNASVLTSLQAIAKKAKERPEYRFRDLFRLLNEEMLRDSWRYIHKDAAYGVDKVSAADYEQNLEANIHQLVEELKRKRYRAKNVLRRYIPKENGKWQSNASWKPSLSRISTIAVMGIVPALEYWTLWINSL